VTLSLIYSSVSSFSLCNRSLLKSCLSLTSSVQHTGLEDAVIDALEYTTALRDLELRELGFFQQNRRLAVFHDVVTYLHHLGLDECLTRLQLLCSLPTSGRNSCDTEWFMKHLRTFTSLKHLDFVVQDCFRNERMLSDAVSSLRQLETLNVCMEEPGHFHLSFLSSLRCLKTLWGRSWGLQHFRRL
jgi:hypothetical protein